MAEYYREMKRIEKQKKEEEIAYYAELAKQEENEIEYYLNLIQDCEEKTNGYKISDNNSDSSSNSSNSINATIHRADCT